MIEPRNISKSFNDQRVLKDVNARFDKGKVNYVIGRSGSGKSVMTKCTGTSRARYGQVLFDKRNFTAMSLKGAKKSERNRNALPRSALFDSMTVSDNIMFP